MFRTLRMALYALFAAGLCALVSQANAGDDKGFVDLFNGKDLTGWKVNIFGKDEGKTFTVKDDYILVAGKPAGYFYTEKSYKNYVLQFDWRYKRPENFDEKKGFGGNSGLLVHIQSHGKGWPNCLEIQGAHGSHASFIQINTKDGNDVGLTGAKFDGGALAKARKAVGEWNTTEMTIKNGEVAVKVNGAPISSAKIKLVEGPFGFQSEGTEIHFKSIKIKVLDN